ncbi:thyroid hormone receptor interactor 12 [Metarhizium album ARSEF 1941]|uniref:HECT-type E3 ubiquitin transferase n=1 Tax=Metarhizium album (strain ARSEF 1941) TaxID=1081103 RepID=A0A0B2WZL0_METAS|nr:thyroid hormone receptor interactor 12 [Metarhizium album ARSEF 1941]KHN99024.1 thyroid hormone receptor interactor 12 [Metarhizium album ARSEF 1941]
MSPRITRSSARQAASQAAHQAGSLASPSAPGTVSASIAPASTSQSDRKRKVSSSTSQEKPPTPVAAPHPNSGRRSKRQKISESPSKGTTQDTLNLPPQGARRKGKATAAMDGNGDQASPAEPPEVTGRPVTSSRKSSRSKKSDSTTPTSARRRSRRNDGSSADQDTAMTGTDENDEPGPPPPPPVENLADDNGQDHDEHGPENNQGKLDNHGEDHDEDEDDEDEEDDDEDEEDPFGGFGGSGGAVAGLSSTLRALTGMMSGLTGRLRELLNNLREDDLSVQVIALQELSEILLVSNEDNLSGHFSPDSFVKELVLLMNKEESPEVMLLACRCLANLMEALPASVANVVYGGAVPVLCQKLLEISFIDLAEQALSTLEKISMEYPANIVREGGLTACLSYLDFFATSTQRTAVTTAANCCRNIPDDSFPVVKDVMPILLNVLNSSDQRVVEQASLCVSGIVESFKYQPAKLEELVSVDLLCAVLRLLVPGTTNLIGSGIHTQFLRVLAFTARASPRLSAELFKLNVVETLYQILTGVSPPSGTENVASKLDSVVVMQALIHRPREQIVETLNVICELLPNLPRNADPAFGDFVELHATTEPITPSSVGGRSRRSPNDKRLDLLEQCKPEVRRFALIIFPTLTDAFSSTVNLSVRQKVLTAQLKMLSNLDEDILTEALVPVPYASFLASILSQQDHPSLVMLGLQATELLVSRLESIYRYQLYREGVIHEINKLASQEDPLDLKKEETDDDKEQGSEDEDEKDEGDGEEKSQDTTKDEINNRMQSSSNAVSGGSVAGGEEREKDAEEAEAGADDNNSSGGEDEDDHDDEDADDDEENDGDHVPGDMSPASSRGSTMSVDMAPHRYISDLKSITSRIRNVAKRFLETHEGGEHAQAMKNKAMLILNDLSDLATELETYYLKRTSATLGGAQKDKELFAKLASYFDTDVLESVTSAELLASGLVQTLLDIFSNPDEELARTAQSTFLEVFMGYSLKSKPKTATVDSPATPFSVLVHKMQDLLSRSEHFEVLTVHHNSFDGNRSSPASMLGKQIRLRLVADDESNIPRPYRNIMVSIHAIATFKSLDDYLRPRISLAERPPIGRRDGLSRALAAVAGMGGLQFSTTGPRLTERSPFGSVPPPPPPPPPPPGATATPSSSRYSRRSKNRSMPLSNTPVTPQDPSAGPSHDKGILRRSSRRQVVSNEETALSRPPPTDGDDTQNTLECADEKQMSDEDDLVDGSTLDAIVGELDEDMDGADATGSGPDPSAVNLEVATGGKITARKDDGTRVPTPSSSALHGSRSGGGNTGVFGAPPPPPPSSGQGTPTPATSRPPMSYALALQAVPQDWHIEFSLDSKVIPNETTIYRAVHTSTSSSDELVSRSIWSATHPIKFRRVPGPSTAEPATFGSNPDSEGETVNGIPTSLAKNPTTASILRLLNILHELNANIEDVLAENRNSSVSLNAEPLSQFVNTKLTAKLNRQLEEPLIVASSCLPGWSEDLARLYPFLFPFETRHLFLQSTSFGYARSMARWQNAQSEDTRRDRNNDRPFLGRLQRQKVRISRLKILESALKVMDLYGASQSILEVEYFEEVGTGLGPTLEFYSTVSKEFSKKKLKLWREMDSVGSEEFVTGQTGLFPRPLNQEELSAPNGERILHLFKMLGKFVARSMIDSRIIDIHFNPIFFRIGDAPSTGIKPSLGAVKIVDPGLARSLKTIKKFALAKKEIDEDPNRTPAQKVADTESIVIDNVRLDDLCLDFTLPGYPNIELEDHGSHKRVTIENVDIYLEKVIDVTLGSGVRQQVDAFRSGFSQVFPYSALSAFTPDELVSLFGKVEEDWSLETLTDSIKADHGFNMDSRSVKNLLQSMSEFDAQQRRDFLQFTTGSPKLPIGGFRSLTPMFTVVCKPSEEPYTSDDYLPSVMTCVNYLKLPDYTTIETMKKQLYKAMKEGQGAFHLS